MKYQREGLTSKCHKGTVRFAHKHEKYDNLSWDSEFVSNICYIDQPICSPHGMQAFEEATIFDAIYDLKCVPQSANPDFTGKRLNHYMSCVLAAQGLGDFKKFISTQRHTLTRIGRFCQLNLTHRIVR